MIGIDGMPANLTADRYCRNASGEDWRKPWDRFDGVLRGWLETTNAMAYTVPVRVYSYRSNLCEVSIFNDASGWAVAWDERFFDYLLWQLLLLSADSEASVVGPLMMRLCAYAAERHALSDPHFAIRLLFEAENPRLEGPPMIMPFDMVPVIESCFRVMRTFVLAHEVGHILVKNPEERERQAENLAAAIGMTHDFLTNPELQEVGQRRFYGPAESYQTFLKDVIARSNGAEREEMLTDMFAIAATMQTEMALVHLHEPNAPIERIAQVLSLVYDAIMLLYFFTAALNGAREIVRPKSIRNGFAINDFQSVRALSARADVRASLWALLSRQIMERDIASLGLLRTNDARLRDHYKRTQLRPFRAFIEKTDYARLLRDTDSLRATLSREDARSQAAAAFRYNL